MLGVYISHNTVSSSGACFIAYPQWFFDKVAIRLNLIQVSEKPITIFCSNIASKVPQTFFFFFFFFFGSKCHKVSKGCQILCMLPNEIFGAKRLKKVQDFINLAPKVPNWHCRLGLLLILYVIIHFKS